MNKLEQLIDKACPNGIEYKTIKEISNSIFRGSGIKRDQVVEDGIPCVRYGEIYTTYDLYFDKCVSHTLLDYVSSPKYFEYGDILFAATGESVEDIAKSIVYIGEEKCLVGGDIIVVKHNQNPKYMAYVLSTADLRVQKSSGKVKSKVVHASISSIEKLIIPLPPLEIQEEIVRMIDAFADIRVELKKELELREKQFNYYKESLLSFNKM